MKTLSIYILNYNYGHYLDKCLNSVFKSVENYKHDVEVALIDDNSNDNSAEIIDKYKSKLDFCIINKSNLGLIKSCNKIIKKLKGRFVVRVDADDYIEADFTKFFLMEIAKNFPDIIYPDYNLVDNSGNKISTYCKSEVSNHLEFDKPFHGAYTAIKKSFLEEINYYDEEFSRQDGYYIWIQSRIRKKIIKHINKPLFNYRQHRTSLSFNKRNLLDTRYDINQKYFKKLVDISKIKILVPIENDQFILERLELLNRFNNIPLDFIVMVKKDILLNFKNKLKFFKNIFIRDDDSLTYINDINSCLKQNKISDFLILEPNYPKLNTKSIIDVLLIAIYNNYDICFSVFIDTNSYLLNEGLSLKPFNHSSNIRFERNELYRIAGGLKYFKNPKTFEYYNSGSQNNLRIGHSEIDEISAIRIQHINSILNEK